MDLCSGGGRQRSQGCHEMDQEDSQEDDKGSVKVCKS